MDENLSIFCKTLSETVILIWVNNFSLQYLDIFFPHDSFASASVYADMKYLSLELLSTKEMTKFSPIPGEGSLL
mgnify:CR=1 FL=1